MAYLKRIFYNEQTNDMMIQKKNSKSHSLTERIFLMIRRVLCVPFFVSRRTQNNFKEHKVFFSNWLITSLIIVFISSCKVGKEYQRPVLELPNQFNNVSAPLIIVLLD